MKAGPHSGDTLEKIINFKLDEQLVAGWFYWGYSGSLCHPKRVGAFIQDSANKNLGVNLVLASTTSHYNPSYFKKAEEISKDSKTWHSIPSYVNLWNCRYALLCEGLKKINAKIRLDDYVLATGASKGQTLDRYIRGRVSKACGFLKTANSRRISHPELQVQYCAKLVSPYCIYVR